MKSAYFKNLKHYFFGLFNKLDNHHVLLLSGGLTFSLFVCALPILLVIFSVLGFLLNETALQEQINLLIDKFIPYKDYASSVKEIIFIRINEVISKQKTAGILGTIGLIFAASGLFGSIRAILNLVYEVQNTKHALLTKLRDFGMVLLVLILFFASTVFLPAIQIFMRSKFMQSLQSYMSQTDHQFGLIITNIFLTLFSLIVVSLILFFIYSLVPDKRPDYKTATVSAVTAAILWELARQAFGYYMVHFASWKELYGAYVLLVVVAFWVYYTSLIFIIAAEVGQLYRENRNP
jgi:membrane protein